MLVRNESCPQVPVAFASIGVFSELSFLRDLRNYYPAKHSPLAQFS